MKNLVLLLPLVLLIGCGTAEYETVADVYTDHIPVAGELSVLLPQQAAATALQSHEGGEMWIFDDFVMTKSVLPGGDLQKTVKTVTGLPMEQLTLITVSGGPVAQYACAWASIGETGEVVNRAAILDDGSYHYVVALQAEADRARELSWQWDAIMASVALNTAP